MFLSPGEDEISDCNDFVFPATRARTGSRELTGLLCLAPINFLCAKRMVSFELPLFFFLVDIFC